MTSDRIKQLKKEIRNLRTSIRISKFLNIFLDKDDSKNNISELKDLSIKVETLMGNLKKIENVEKIEQKQDIPQELDDLKGNHKKINNSIYKKIFKKIRTNTAKVLKNTATLVVKILSTAQKGIKSLIENNRRQILINKIKQVNDKVRALGGESQLPANLYSMSIGDLKTVRDEVRTEKDIQVKQFKQKSITPKHDLTKLAIPSVKRAPGVIAYISARNSALLTKTKTQTIQI